MPPHIPLKICVYSCEQFSFLQAPFVSYCVWAGSCGCGMETVLVCRSPLIALWRISRQFSDDKKKFLCRCKRWLHFSVAGTSEKCENTIKKLLFAKEEKLRPLKTMWNSSVTEREGVENTFRQTGYAMVKQFILQGRDPTRFCCRLLAPAAARFAPWFS